MPTILNADLAAAWVSSALTTNEIQTIAGTKIESNALQAHTVAKNFLQVTNPCEKQAYQIFTPQTLF
jgi:hypothetical protein